VDACSYDINDCNPPQLDPSVYCAQGCKWAWVGDGECDLGCLVEGCSNDINDCY
jgi:hypothetical protein